LKGCRILLADDAPDNRLLMSTVLLNCGAGVECAENGNQAVDIALRKNFDVILMDIEMPHLDGVQALTLLRARGYKKPIVALTGHGRQEEVNHYLDIGFSAHLLKPIKKSELIETIARLTEIHVDAEQRPHVPHYEDYPVH